jgi:hypothetical protein
MEGGQLIASQVVQDGKPRSIGRIHLIAIIVPLFRTSQPDYGSSYHTYVYSGEIVSACGNPKEDEQGNRINPQTL